MGSLKNLEQVGGNTHTHSFALFLGYPVTTTAKSSTQESNTSPGFASCVFLEKPQQQKGKHSRFCSNSLAYPRRLDNFRQRQRTFSQLFSLTIIIIKTSCWEGGRHRGRGGAAGGSGSAAGKFAHFRRPFGAKTRGQLRESCSLSGGIVRQINKKKGTTTLVHFRRKSP